MHFLRGSAAFLFIILNTLWVWIPLAFWLLQRLWTRGAALSRLEKRMDLIIWWWTGNNRRMLDTLGVTAPRIEWHGEQVSFDHWYMVICNHQSWTDILLLQCFLRDRIAPLKFFTKAQLIWIPLVGLAMYVLNFPYVKRVSKAQIKANPKLRNADKENVARACMHFKNHPTCVLNFIEGTRRTQEKQTQQNSEFDHLLRPKIGGLEYVLQDMSSHLHKLLDVTIVYPDGVPTFWEFLQGRAQNVIMEITPHDIPPEVIVEDPVERRAELSAWVKEIWTAKDSRIAHHLKPPR
ncbi:MAG: acetyltransferase [Pseudomonadota bacterium]